MQFIPRLISPYLLEANRYYPVTVVSGPRQTGKTTLCRHLYEDYKFYNFEDPSLYDAVVDDPIGFLKDCGPKVIIDEAQRIPDIFSYIQVMADENRERRFILTGSSNYLMMQQVSQSMAGRAAVFTLLPFSLAELEPFAMDRDTDRLLIEGFFPGVVARHISTDIFFSSYLATYIDRDVRLLKNVANLPAFRTFMRLLAGRVGTEFNASAIMSQIGVTSATVKSWLGVLETSYLTFPLSPYLRNINKRLIKTPKIYFTDCGLLCYLLGITTPEQLAVHPLRGQIFENMIVVEFLKGRFNAVRRPDVYFYREVSGYEVDIVQEPTYGTVNLYEVKSSSTYNPAFMTGLNHLAKLLGDGVASKRVIYNGDTIPPNIFNYRTPGLYDPN